MSTLDEIQEGFDRAIKAQDDYLADTGSLTSALVATMETAYEVRKLVAALKAVQGIALLADTHHLAKGWNDALDAVVQLIKEALNG